MKFLKFKKFDRKNKEGKIKEKLFSLFYNDFKMQGSQIVLDEPFSSQERSNQHQHFLKLMTNYKFVK
jgi:hypothetical protein